MAEFSVAAECLRPVPVIYIAPGELYENAFDNILHFSSHLLRRPFVLISGQTDSALTQVAATQSLLADPNLVAWFAQNSDVAHPKLRQIPIGLNCYEMCREMDQALSELTRKDRTATAKPPSKLLFANFGSTHSSRKIVWEHFCGTHSRPPVPWATCVPKSRLMQNNITGGNPQLVGYYKELADHMFVLAPRGNGLDTHRVWEAFHLGVVPIVASSALDPLYRSTGLPIMIVDDWTQITKEVLVTAYKSFHGRLKRGLAGGVLHRDHWAGEIEAARLGAVSSPREQVNRNGTTFKCWGAAFHGELGRR